ncbi:EAL domain-containing protein [Klebsiella aerogenes]|uniref:Putative fimbrial protein n=1 Tax=Klebsiella aerogenes (strain ATCC 13048 / DSM 30053 / CCUG 1429 / JCM 1235 / KCTC 2190 / NBRC 13534 / NCIMB 10102 / NCTC 10006 / CDC 819-56) TaxID=1028307 RepID=A0A0H3FZ77_KLEAK|nr:EAL domain-containing protein [Klebsiella aerogenes]AEG99851.1 putative fimbrial protein [Klebsiella aerogenes KCTC 2190]EIV6645062.1 EAL domain-containing protein [Klebsiella aerogenes]EKZ9670636.1 EAL domain-containing protein [Klebsiella aerogenes]EKZ9812205.1 EAL domain-containing protein [Klebsiella aerogenes]ELA0149970.1 EAL domain-containing protein [Klebsiella aerogenes]
MQLSTICNPINNIETEFMAGLTSGVIYPVFQPIVNNNKKILGFEMLIRWMVNGKEMTAGEFIDDIKSTEAHIKLANFLIDAAVKKIIKYNGALFFSVNITVLDKIVTEKLYNIISSLKEKYLNNELIKLLVLEFSESLDFYKDSKSVDNIKTLSQLNVTIELDDCFSSRSVNFPVRSMKFNGYKLDREVVSAFSKNIYDESLIRSLLYFCALTDSYCTAEGINNYNEMHELYKIGVRRFQGFWISKPVLENELDSTIRYFGLVK